MRPEQRPPIERLLRTGTAKILTLSEAQAESALKVGRLLKLLDELHFWVRSSMEKHHYQAREAAPSGHLSKLVEGGRVLVARFKLNADKSYVFVGADLSELSMQ